MKREDEQRGGLVGRADRLRRQIMLIMEEVGVYSPIFDLLIESVATNKSLCDEMFEMISRDGLTIVETSREGETRYRPNPLLTTRLEYEKSLRSSLTELMMTVKSSNIMGGDEFDELNKRINDLMGQADAELGERKATKPKNRNGKATPKSKDKLPKAPKGRR